MGKSKNSDFIFSYVEFKDKEWQSNIIESIINAIDCMNKEGYKTFKSLFQETEVDNSFNKKIGKCFYENMYRVDTDIPYNVSDNFFADYYKINNLYYIYKKDFENLILKYKNKPFKKIAKKDLTHFEDVLETGEFVKGLESDEWYEQQEISKNMRMSKEKEKIINALKEIIDYIENDEFEKLEKKYVYKITSTTLRAFRPSTPFTYGINFNTNYDKDSYHALDIKSAIKKMKDE